MRETRALTLGLVRVPGMFEPEAWREGYRRLLCARLPPGTEGGEGVAIREFLALVVAASRHVHEGHHAQEGGPFSPLGRP